MKNIFLLLPLVLVACATQTPSLESRFKAADVDGDGLVSRHEATNVMISQVFEIFDANGDGVLTEAEYVAGGGDATEFREAARKSGGSFTLADAQADPAAIETMAVPFDEADVNGNGAITLEELKTYQARLHEVVR